MHPLKKGALYIARQAEVPIQPVAIHNDPPFLPHEDRWYYPSYETSTIQLEFLDPIVPDKGDVSRKLAADLDERLRAALAIGDAGRGPGIEENSR